MLLKYKGDIPMLIPLLTPLLKCKYGTVMFWLAVPKI